MPLSRERHVRDDIPVRLPDQTDEVEVGGVQRVNDHLVPVPDDPPAGGVVVPGTEVSVESAPVGVILELEGYDGGVAERDCLCGDLEEGKPESAAGCGCPAFA